MAWTPTYGAGDEVPSVERSSLRRRQASGSPAHVSRAGCELISRTSFRAALGGVLFGLLWVMLAGAAAIEAQSSPTGTVHGRVVDETGRPLRGVSIVLTGNGPDREQLVDAEGRFRFLALAPGNYRIATRLHGPSDLALHSVTVSAGASTILTIELQSQLSEEIVVKAQSPLLDKRNITSGTSVPVEEVERIPTGRDPWALLKQAPFVLVDRDDVAGSESANQSSFRAPAVDPDQNDHQIDGVSVTERWSQGRVHHHGSSIYYDMDQYAEVQYSIGGTDVTRGAAGVTINLISKRGSNEFRGSMRYNATDADGYFGGALRQSSTDLSPDDLGPGQEALEGARIRDINEMGIEAGGALVRNRLFLWGSLGEKETATFAATGDPIGASLFNSALRLDSQITPANSMTASWSGSSREERAQGAGLGRAPETLMDEDRDVDLYRVQDTHIFSSDLFLDLTYQYRTGAPVWRSRGGAGPDAPEPWWDRDFVLRGNFQSGASGIEEDQYRLDGSYFLVKGELDQELRFGGSKRDQEHFSQSVWPGRGIVTHVPFEIVFAYRGGKAPVALDLGALWYQHTLQRGRSTLNLGLRWDHQEGRNLPSAVAANPAFPAALPAIDYPGNSPEFTWSTLSPRLGLTWDLGNQGRTLLRLSLARFADRLGVARVRFTNPVKQTRVALWSPGLDGPYQDEPAYLLSFFDSESVRSPQNPHQLDPGLDARRPPTSSSSGWTTRYVHSSCSACR